MGLAQFLGRLLRPPRTTRPTREGWWFLLATLGLGVAALNTGTNLLYLLVSMLLGLIVASGILCEQSMRGLRLSCMVPQEIFAGQATLFGLALVNTKRRLTSYSLALEVPRVGAPGAQMLYVPRLAPGQEKLVTFEEEFPRRGRHRLPAVRVLTRFPFGLFAKATRELPEQEVLVFPRVGPVTPEDLRALAAGGAEPGRRAGQGIEFHGLRDYRWGDDPRMIHWKSSAKTETLMVRELEADTAMAVCLLLEPPRGPIEPEQLEASLSRAASLASHLIGAGARVELAGPGLRVPAGRGEAHLRRILKALALFSSDEGADGSAAPDETRTAPGNVPAEAWVRVIRIPLAGVVLQ